jgi:hypothetical protein
VAFDVTIAPDGADPGLGNKAETRLAVAWVEPEYEWTKDRPKAPKTILSFTPPSATVRIQTFYGPKVQAGTQSSYGRGTTPADIAGGRVTRESTTVGFHEGSHGRDYVDWLRTKPMPAFAGVIGMTKRDFLRAIASWVAAMARYRAEMKRRSEHMTDCVGMTIDIFNAHGRRAGARIRLICKP